MPKDKNIEAIRNLPDPKNVTELRRFLGNARYYRRFVMGFVHLANPLFQLLKKGVPFKLNAKCKVAIQTIKAALTRPPCLALPRWDIPFILYTDASDVGLGAVLS